MTPNMTNGLIPSAEEAREILSRFNASHFRLADREHARYRIPADPRHDDDVRLAAFINHARALQLIVDEASRCFYGPDEQKPGTWGYDVAAKLHSFSTPQS